MTLIEASRLPFLTRPPLPRVGRGAAVPVERQRGGAKRDIAAKRAATVQIAEGGIEVVEVEKDAGGLGERHERWAAESAA